MYDVNTQGTDECMINVHYHYCSFYRVPVATALQSQAQLHPKENETCTEYIWPPCCNSTARSQEVQFHPKENETYAEFAWQPCCCSRMPQQRWSTSSWCCTLCRAWGPSAGGAWCPAPPASASQTPHSTRRACGRCRTHRWRSSPQESTVST